MCVFQSNISETFIFKRSIPNAKEMCQNSPESGSLFSYFPSRISLRTIYFYTLNIKILSACTQHERRTNIDLILNIKFGSFNFIFIYKEEEKECSLCRYRFQIIAHYLLHVLVAVSCR